MNHKKSILIVDDDKAILENTKGILQLNGYSVDAVETGHEAIEMSKVQFYNLALLDIKLPDMEGTQLLAKMNRTTPKMMKIMITGYPMVKNAVESLNFGADAYLLKPVDPEELLKVIENKLKEQEETEEMSEERVNEWIKSRVRKLKANYNAKL